MANRNRILQYIKYGIGIFVVVFVLMQFGRFVIPEFKLDNPPVTHTVTWDSPETERLFYTACADCHSNETIYPWYSYIAPVGWLVAYDIHEGRDKFNISENHRIELHEMIEVLEDGEMPLPIYTIIHRDAVLSADEQQIFMAGLRATFGNSRNND